VKCKKLVTSREWGTCHMASSESNELNENKLTGSEVT
jgi:hypothetical protein